MTGAPLQMSTEAMIWALEEAPDVPAHCLGTLMGLANHADKQGRGSYAGQKLLGDYARKTDRQARSDLAALLERGLIRRGDQSLVSHIPTDARPIVYDLAMERKSTSGRKSASAGASASKPTWEQLADQRERRGSGSPLPTENEGAEAGFRGGRKPTSGGSGSRLPTNQENSSTKSSRKSPGRNLNDGRDDARRLCDHLAERVADNGNLRPAITQDWLTEARLLMDKDGRTEVQIHKAIDWCQTNTFWRKNVMSMPTLRDKYDRLRMEAEDERHAAANGGNSRHQPYRNPTDQDAYEHEELRRS